MNAEYFININNFKRPVNLVYMSNTAVRITIDCQWNILRHPSQTDRQTDV